MDSIQLKRLAQLQPADVGQSEENVKQKFAVPLLEALGHDKKNLDFEHSTAGGREEIRLYSPLRGISFKRSLLHSIQRRELDSHRAFDILQKFLSRDDLTSGKVSCAVDEREKELRSAYAKIEEIEEKRIARRENVNEEIVNCLIYFKVRSDEPFIGGE